MIDIKELTNDEIAEWCEAVTHQFIKESFKHNPKGYNKLIKAVSTPVAKLTNPDIEKIVQNNKSNKFISDMYNEINELELKKIKKKISELVESGMDEVWATCEALSNNKSNFCGHFDLYFKLAENDNDIANAALVKNISDLMTQVNGISELEKENRELEAQIEDSNKEIEGLKAKKLEYEEQISKLNADIKSEKSSREKAEKDIYDLTEDLKLANIEIENLKSEKAVPVVTDKEPKYTKNTAFDYTSVCKVIYNPYKNIKMLKRLADVDENGEIIEFIQNEGPKTFSNRDQLYMSDNESVVEDTIAIWDWSALVNDYDSDKDFITSALNIKVKPIVKINGNFQPQELLSLLKNGISVPKGSRRFMFVVQQGGDTIGIVVSEGEYSILNDTLKINNDVVCLPKYKVSLLFDFIQIENDMYYRYLDLNNFAGYEPVKNPIESVKDIVVGRATRKVFTDYGFNTKEWNIAKKFVENIPADDLLAEIQDKFKCSLGKAKEYLNEFSSHANEYFEGTSEENQALLSAINSSPELYKKCEEAVRTDWECKNSVMIDNAQKEFDRIKEKNEDKQSELRELEEKFAEKEKLADEVNKKVAEKILSAQNNAAEFISTMTFVNPLASRAAIPTGSSAIVRPGNSIDDAESEELNSFEDWLDICFENFKSLGIYVDEFSDNLAVFMYTAYAKKIPLILSGPGAKGIVDAFSCSMFGKTAAYVNCTGDSSSNILDEIIPLSDEIVVIDNAFSSAWVNRIMNLITIPEKFYILVRPFSEDLLI